MAHSIPKQSQTQGDVLRDLLETCYTAAVNSRGMGAEQAQQLLHDLDRIVELFDELDAQGMDLRAERGRWQEVQGAVRRHADALRAALAPLGGIRTLRAGREPAPSPQTHWWWWLDVRARQKTRRGLLKILTILAVVALLIGGGLWAFDKFFPVDPKIAQAYEHKINAENALAAGDKATAIAELELAHQVAPDDFETDTLLAALYDCSGQPQKMQPLLDALLAAYPPTQIHASLAQSYMATGCADKAMPLARQAIADDPTNSQGYLILGSIYETNNETELAVEAYQKAADMANQAKDYESEAFAKIRLATLLQKARGPVPAPAQ